MTTTAPETSVGVVIPAAGAGLRLGGERKQFRMLAGKPLLVHTVDIFERHPEIDVVVVVSPDDAVDEVSAMMRRHQLHKVGHVVAGAGTRQGSVANGLEALARSTEIVITHDAVRPLVDGSDISLLIQEVRRTGAASLASGVSDTLVRASEQAVGETVNRDGLYRMLTPQGFKTRLLHNAHSLALQRDETFTDEVTLVRSTGHDVTLVSGSPLNIKITTPADWALIEWLWPAWKAR